MTLEKEWGKYDFKTFSEFKHQLGLESLYKIFDKVFKGFSGSYKKFREKAEYSVYCKEIGKNERTYTIVAHMFQYCLEHVGIKDNPEEKFHVGDEALWPGFFSCSADREAAEGFLKTASGRMTNSLLFEVVIPRDSRALYVATMS